MVFFSFFAWSVLSNCDDNQLTICFVNKKILIFMREGFNFLELALEKMLVDQ